MRARAGRAQRGPRRAGRGGRGSTWRQGRSPSGGAHRLASRGRSRRRRGVEQQEAAGERDPCRVASVASCLEPSVESCQTHMGSSSATLARNIERRAPGERARAAWVWGGGAGRARAAAPPTPHSAPSRMCPISRVPGGGPPAVVHGAGGAARRGAACIRGQGQGRGGEGGGLSAHRSRKRICASMVGSTGRWRAQASWAAPRGRSPRPERLSCKPTPADSSAPPPELGRRASTRWRRRCAWWQGAWSTSSS